MRKPRQTDAYTPQQLSAVRSACFWFVSAVGDNLDDLVIVGGLVPSLLAGDTQTRTDGHVGTLDLDIGLQVAIRDKARYRRLARRLRDRGFEPGSDKEGRATSHRWQNPASGTLVDFLAPPPVARARKGALIPIDQDLAAIAVPGLRLAFRDQERVPIAHWAPKGLTIRPPERASAPVCGPGAFVALKALAFRDRREPKDAYDLHWLLSHYGNGEEDVAARLHPLLDDWDAQQALDCLRGDFAHLDSPGPVAVADFLLHGDDDGLKADVAGSVARLLDAL